MKQVNGRPTPPFQDQGIAKPGLEEAMSPRPQYLVQRYRPAGNFIDKHALITGGDSGIVRAVGLMAGATRSRSRVRHTGFACFLLST